MKSRTGEPTLPKLKDHEIAPGVFLITEPAPVPETDKLRALANVDGCLALVELRLRFGEKQ